MLLRLLLTELGDGSLLGVSCCLGLPAGAKMGVAAEAGVPWAVLVALPAACQLPLKLVVVEALILIAQLQALQVVLPRCLLRGEKCENVQLFTLLLTN